MQYIYLDHCWVVVFKPLVKKTAFLNQRQFLQCRGVSCTFSRLLGLVICESNNVGRTKQTSPIVAIVMIDVERRSVTGSYYMSSKKITTSAPPHPAAATLFPSAANGRQWQLLRGACTKRVKSACLSAPVHIHALTDVTDVCTILAPQFI